MPCFAYQMNDKLSSVKNFGNWIFLRGQENRMLATRIYKTIGILFCVVLEF